MRGNWEVWHLTRPEQFFSYASGYLRAAIRNEESEESEELPFEWSDAAASLMLLAHAVELFLKGAILHRSGALQKGHNLRCLKNRYDELFTEPQFQWVLPFQTEYLEMSDEEIEEAKRSEPIPSVLYRYPEDFYEKPWHGVFGYEKGEHIPWDVLEQILELQQLILRT